ncbi:MAG: hypothetical protein Q9183_006549 [Haloplaca sp. 2 TL-2023]
MEEERLARKRKREGEAEVEYSSSGRKSARVEISSADEVRERVPTALVLMVSGDILHADRGISIPGHVQREVSSTTSANPPPILPYPYGTVKKTYALKHPRSSDDITLEEILQPSSLSLTVLSSFQWDMQWLFKKLNTSTTQLVLVMQADDEDTKTLYRRETAAMKNLKLCFPSMAGQVNCMHSKLMLLSYPTHLRVAVPTANLVPYDWGETGVMENSVFVIDLPRLPDNSRKESQEMTDFGKDLIYFLKAMGLGKSIINSLHHFDFSATEDLAFVHSIGGAHSGESEPWRKTGYCGLGQAVSRLGLTANNNPLEIDYVTSSVGSLNLDFLSTIYMAAKGDDGMTEYGWRNNQPKKKDKDYHRLMKEMNTSRETAREETESGFRIYFPSEETVKKSTGGPDNGGTICFQSKWWDGPKFPREVMRDCRSRRKGLLMHNKIMYVQPALAGPVEASDKEVRGEEKAWAYIGSANCSESAWGRMVKDRESKQVKLNCRNWECGVVIPLRRMASMGAKSNVCGREDGVLGGSEKVNGLKKFEGVVPVPMEMPGKGYGDGRPWFYSEYL